jgi:DNA-directed RNA polymerase specialized sigma24 family protein
MSARESQIRVLGDRDLVDRCLAGEVLAWQELYDRHHRGIVAAIRRFFRARSPDSNLVDEIAARSWYAIVADGGRVLGQFDPQRGCRLSTFLATIARSQAGQYLRSEQRRRRRERAVGRMAIEGPSDSAESAAVEMTEFLDTLTPRERSFCELVLLDRDGGEHLEFSVTNAWKLRSRIKGKLQDFVGGPLPNSTAAQVIRPGWP